MLGEVVTGGHVALHVDTVNQEGGELAEIGRIEKTSTSTGSFPEVGQGGLARDVVGLTEPEFMGVGVPTILTVCDLQGANERDRAKGTVALGIAKTLESVTLLEDEILETMPGAMGESERDQETDQTLSRGPGDGLFNLEAATFLDPGGTDRAGPDRATGNQTGVERRAMLQGPHDVDVRMAQVATIGGSVDVSRVGVRAELTGVTPEDVTGLGQGLVAQGSGCFPGLVRVPVRGFRSSP